MKPSPSRESLGTPDRWFVLSLLATNYFALYLHRNLINYLQPPLIEELGLTDEQLGLLHWGFLVTYALSQLFVGYLGDRFSRRSVLLASLFSSTLALAAMGLVNNFAQLLMLRVLLAITQSASVPAIAGIMADCFTARSRSRAVSVYLLSSPASLIVAGWLGGRVADEYDWRTCMFVFAGMGAAIGLLLLFLLREPRRTERMQSVGLGMSGASLFSTLWSVVTVPSFILLALAYVLVSNVGQLTVFWLPRHFFELFDTSLEGAGKMATLPTQCGTVVGLLLGGVWGDWWAERQFRGRFAVQLIGVLACVPALLVIGTSHDRHVLMIAMFVFGLASWLYLANLWTTSFEVVDPAARSTAIGLLNVATGVLGAWISPLVGRLRDKQMIDDLGDVFRGTAALAAVAAMLLVVILVFTLPADYRVGEPRRGELSEE